MFIYVKGEVFLSDGAKDLHLTRIEVTDFDSLTDEKADEILTKLNALFIKKSEGVSCKTEVISQNEYASLCGPFCKRN